MERLRATERTFTNVETGNRCRLYITESDQYRLIAEGNEQHEVKRFYISAHTAAAIRLNTKAEIYVERGTFYNLKEGEIVTHRKFVGFNKFTKA